MTLHAPVGGGETRERIFNLVPGFLAVPSLVTLSADGSERVVRLDCAADPH